MVIPELLDALGALDEDEQRALAKSLNQRASEDAIEMTGQQQNLIRSRYAEMRTKPGTGLTLGQVRARTSELLAE